ncbi:hypothetical protein [Pseudomonas cichorii]|uniref:hypothetical protein n=1 Tax=Pseudomonas cichorii TaxID=36746 RepID=UPI001C7FD64B|nr:hypothetical protein [Pseudomonas cichorii]
MKNHVGAITLVTSIFTQAMVQAADYEKASEIKSARHGDKVARYVKECGSP